MPPDRRTINLTIHFTLVASFHPRCYSDRDFLGIAESSIRCQRTDDFDVSMDEGKMTRVARGRKIPRKLNYERRTAPRVRSYRMTVKIQGNLISRQRIPSPAFGRRALIEPSVNKSKGRLLTGDEFPKQETRPTDLLVPGENLGSSMKTTWLPGQRAT